MVTRKILYLFHFFIRFTFILFRPFFRILFFFSTSFPPQHSLWNMFTISISLFLSLFLSYLYLLLSLLSYCFAIYFISRSYHNSSSIDSRRFFVVFLLMPTAESLHQFIPAYSSVMSTFHFIDARLSLCNIRHSCPRQFACVEAQRPERLTTPGCTATRLTCCTLAGIWSRLQDWSSFQLPQTNGLTSHTRTYVGSPTFRSIMLSPFSG
jgi:hypothetical protein